MLIVFVVFAVCDEAVGQLEMKGGWNDASRKLQGGKSGHKLGV